MGADKIYSLHDLQYEYQQKSQAKKPKDLFQLPQDKINVYRPPKSTKEEFEK